MASNPLQGLPPESSSTLHLAAFSLDSGCSAFRVDRFHGGGLAGMKLRCDREQTAHLQTALWHLPVRTRIRTAQPGSIRSTHRMRAFFLVGHGHARLRIHSS